MGCLVLLDPDLSPTDEWIIDIFGPNAIIDLIHPWLVFLFLFLLLNNIP